MASTLQTFFAYASASVAHTLAVLFKLLFFGLGFAGLLCLLKKQPAWPRPHALVLGAILCLFMSRVCASFDLGVLAWLLVLFILFAGVDLVFSSVVVEAGNLFLPVALLVAVGCALQFDIAPSVNNEYELLGSQVDIGIARVQQTCLACVVCALVFLLFQPGTTRGAKNVVARYLPHVYRHTAALFVGGSRRVSWIKGHYIHLLITVLLLCAVELVPFLQVTANGAIVGIRILGVTVQLSEFAKSLLVIALAGYIAAHDQGIVSFRLSGYGGLLIAGTLLAMVEVWASDVGALAILVGVTVLMLVCCVPSRGTPYKPALVLIFAALGLVGVVAIYAAGKMGVNQHVVSRFNAWAVNASIGGLNPLVKPQFDAVQQTINDAAQQNLIDLTQQINGISVLGDGGIFGTGLGFGVIGQSASFVRDGQTLNFARYVQAVDTDYVISAVSLLLGLVGLALVLLAFVTIARRMIVVASGFDAGSFESNLFVGTSGLVSLQSLVIVGGCLGFIPLTGITFPFVSRGNSSLFALLLLVGFSAAVACSCEQEHDVHFERQSGFVGALPTVLAVLAGVALVRAGACQPSSRLCGYTARDITFNVTTREGASLVSFASFADGSYTIEYPQGNVAEHIVSPYSSGSRLVSVRDILDASARSVVANVLALPQALPDEQLTLDLSVERAAADRLEEEGKTGGIVVLNVRTGEVLAEASYPTFDIDNPKAATEGSYSNNAVGARFAPGSTFKVVTMASALENGVAGPESIYSGNQLVLGGVAINNMGQVNYGPISLTTALRVSSNTAFARLGLDLGGERLVATAEAFGFVCDGGKGQVGDTGSDVPGSVASLVAVPPYDAALAWESVGQPTVFDYPRATVLEMCSVVATIANGGMRCEPYLVASASGEVPLGGVTGGPRDSKQVMTQENAQTLWNMMVASAGVDEEGLAGKTGTAEITNGTSCWYICAKGDYAVACCLTGSTSDLGSTLARPVALDVLHSIE